MDMKLVVHLKDGYAHIGVQEEGADPVMERVEVGSLDEALGAVLDVLEDARRRWAENRRNPKYDGPLPAPPPRAPATTTPRSGQSRAPQESGMQQLL